MRVVLVGGGGHSSDVLGVFEAIAKRNGTNHPVIGIVADSEIDEARFVTRGVRQVGSISDLKQLDVSHFVVAIGWSQARREVTARVASYGLSPMTVVHPNVELPPSVVVGEGSVILIGACISPMAKIGRHVYLSHGALIGHDCSIHDFVTVLPGAAVSGDTLLEEACLIGTNASILQRLTVGREATVGAGAVVTRDVPARTTVVGSPARVLPTQ